MHAACTAPDSSSPWLRAPAQWLGWSVYDWSLFIVVVMDVLAGLALCLTCCLATAMAMGAKPPAGFTPEGVPFMPKRAQAEGDTYGAGSPPGAE